MSKHPHTGTSSRVELSPKRRKARQTARRRQDARWQARNGPVVVSKVEPRPDVEQEQDDA